MKVKVTNAVLDYQGKPVVGGGLPGPDKKLPLLSWRTVIYLALNQIDAQHPATAEEKLRAYQITQKTYASAEPDFTVQERAVILEKIGAIYNPLVYGRAQELFEDGVAPNRAARRRAEKEESHATE